MLKRRLGVAERTDHQWRSLTALLLFFGEAALTIYTDMQFRVVASARHQMAFRWEIELADGTHILEGRLLGLEVRVNAHGWSLLALPLVLKH